MSQVYLQTSKTPTKDVPCQHLGCDNICRVNTFYAKAKARCDPHKGTKGAPIAKTLEGEVTEPVEYVPPPPPVPNERLRALMCPTCDTEEPLEILACTEDGHIDFGCQECWMIVSYMFRWKPLQARSIPKPLRDLVKAFNLKQVGTMDIDVARQVGRFGASSR